MPVQQSGPFIVNKASVSNKRDVSSYWFYIYMLQSHDLQLSLQTHGTIDNKTSDLKEVDISDYYKTQYA